MLLKPQNRQFTHLGLSYTERIVLRDIQSFLYVPHKVQELLSAEKTPTLSVTLPAYMLLIATLKDLVEVLPHIAFAIDVAIIKLEEYVEKSCKSSLYTLSMSKSCYFLS